MGLTLITELPVSGGMDSEGVSRKRFLLALRCLCSDTTSRAARRGLRAWERGKPHHRDLHVGTDTGQVVWEAVVRSRGRGGEVGTVPPVGRLVAWDCPCFPFKMRKYDHVKRQFTT